MGIRRDWYQSDERIILALLTKGAQNVKVDFQVKQISVSGTGKGRFSVYFQLRKKEFSTFSHPHFKLNNMKQKIEFDPSPSFYPVWYSRPFFKNRKIGNRAEKFLCL